MQTTNDESRVLDEALDDEQCDEQAKCLDAVVDERQLLLGGRDAV